MSIWPEIKKAVNTDIGTPLNHLTWLNDYKLFGEDSYVFKNTNILHELYKDYELCMNDNDILEETFAFVVENDNEVGKALSQIYGIELADIMKTLDTMNSVANNEMVMNAIVNNEIVTNAIFHNEIATNVIFNNETATNIIANSQTAINTIANSQTAINAVLSNETAMSIIANSQTAMNTIANSQIAINAMLSSEIAKNIIVNSQTAMSIIANSQTAMNTIANNQTAINAVFNSEIAMNTVFNSKIAMNIIANSKTIMNTINNSSKISGKYIASLAGLNCSNISSIEEIVNNSTNMNAVINSSTAMNAITLNGMALKAIAKSSSNWSVKKPFIMKVNEIGVYIKNIYTVLTNTKYFTSKVSAYGASTNSTISSYCTASYAANGFIACYIGGYYANEGYGTRLKINGDTIKEAIYPNTKSQEASVTADNINAIAIPTATFEHIQSGWTAITVYIAT